MNLSALQHLARAAQSLADDCEIIVLGSASLLASFPELGDPDGPLTSTYDADICPQPFDETTGKMLEEALGESRSFHLRHGYHADVLRESIFETLPLHWQKRLVAVPGCPRVLALDPNDLATVKILVGRPKDLTLAHKLLVNNLVDPLIIRSRIDELSIPVELVPALLARFQSVLTG